MRFTPTPLAGRRVVVTGASSGIGRAVVRELAGRGAAVVAVARDAGDLHAAVSGLAGVRVAAVDVTSPAGQRSLLEQAGPFDALVNDAGVGWTGLFADMPLDEIDRIVAVNLLAVLRLSRLALDRLGPGGHLVNVGSLLGVVSSPPLTVYAATKFAVRGFSTGLRRELAGTGVHVTEIRPGPVDTAFFPAAVSRPRAARIPRFPMMDPELVAAAIRRALEHPGWPGYRTISVPRAGAVGQLGALAGGRAVVDLVARATRSPLVLRPHPGRPDPEEPVSDPGGRGSPAPGR